MDDNHNNLKIDGGSSSIKIVVAGTIASGKTTLLGALSAYEEKGSVSVGVFSPSGVNSQLFIESDKFRRKAYNCFNNTSESQCLNSDPWPGATDPNEIPQKIGLDITSGGISHRVSFCDFAGETFLNAFDEINEGQKKTGKLLGRLLDNQTIKDRVGQMFKEEIEDANMVLIVISSKDIIDFPDLWERERNSAERMQFAYSIMKEKAKELQSLKKDVEVFFVITQCDQYKALISSKKDYFEDELNHLIAGAPTTPIQIIYTSSVYQTELKQIKTEVDKSINLKFCPVSHRLKRQDQPSSLGIKALVQHICNVSSRVAAERMRKIDEELERRAIERNELEEKLEGLARSVEDAMAEVQKTIAGGRVSSDRLMDLNADKDRLARALRDYNEVVRTCDNTNEGMKAVIGKLETDIDNVINRHKGLMRWCR